MITDKQALAMLWLNNTKIIQSNLKLERPCKKLGWCPYGQLVEAFRLRSDHDKKISCNLFGHDCPMFYHAEDVSEARKIELYNKDMAKKGKKK